MFIANHYALGGLMSDSKSIVTWGFGHSGGGYSVPHIMTDGLLDTAKEFVETESEDFLWFRKGWFSRLRKGDPYEE